VLLFSEEEFDKELSTDIKQKAVALLNWIAGDLSGDEILETEEVVEKDNEDVGDTDDELPADSPV